MTAAAETEAKVTKPAEQTSSEQSSPTRGQKRKRDISGQTELEPSAAQTPPTKKRKSLSSAADSTGAACSSPVVILSDSEPEDYGDYFTQDIFINREEQEHFNRTKQSVDLLSPDPVRTRFRMSGRDLAGLEPGQMTTDNIISMASSLLAKRQRTKNMPTRCYFANALLSMNTTPEHWRHLKKHKIDASKLDLLFFPAHIEVLYEGNKIEHWILLVVDIGKKQIYRMDSLCSDYGLTRARQLRKWLQSSAIAPLGHDFSQYKIKRWDPPLQDTNSCAIAVIWCMDHLSRGNGNLITQQAKAEGSTIYAPYRKAIKNTFIKYCDKV